MGSIPEVSGNKGAAGVDGQSLAEFEQNLRNNLNILHFFLIAATSPKREQICDFDCKI